MAFCRGNQIHKTKSVKPSVLSHPSVKATLVLWVKNSHWLVSRDICDYITFTAERLRIGVIAPDLS